MDYSNIKPVKKHSKLDDIQAINARLDAMVEELLKLKVCVIDLAKDDENTESKQPMPDHPPLIFFDLEALAGGGRSKTKTHLKVITQIAAISIFRGDSLQFSMYVDPKKPKPPNAVKPVLSNNNNGDISATVPPPVVTSESDLYKLLAYKVENGISDDEEDEPIDEMPELEDTMRVKIMSDTNQKSMYEMGIELIKFIEKVTSSYTGKVYLLAHNCKSVDSRILICNLQRNGIELPRNIMFVDTIAVIKNAITRGLHRSFASYGLAEMYEHFTGKKLGKAAHHALTDTEALVTIIRALIRVDNLNTNIVSFFDTYILPNGEPIAAVENRIHKTRK